MLMSWKLVMFCGSGEEGRGVAEWTRSLRSMLLQELFLAALTLND